MINNRNRARQHEDALCVLVVDDEEEIRIEIVDYLERKGYTTLSASDGEEAWLVFGRADCFVAAIITDVKMPRCDGHELIKRVRAVDECVPMIAVTGHYSADELEKLEASGANLTVKKPARLRELYAALVDLTRPRLVERRRSGSL